MGLGTLVLAAIAGVALKRVGLAYLVAGALVVRELMLVLTAVMVPGASYLFTWPILAMLPGAALLLLTGGAALVLFVPLVWLVFTAIDFTSAALISMIAALVALLLVPVATLVSLPRRRVAAVRLPVEPGRVGGGKPNPLETGGVM